MSGNQDNMLDGGGEQEQVVIHGPAQFGHALRRIRESRGIDQAVLAEMADVHRTYVSKIENHTPSDTLGRMLAMLRALDHELVIRPRRQP